MMRKIFTLILFAAFGLSNAQTTEIRFDYDSAGNQVKRSLCINCPATTGKKVDTKETAVLEEKDLQKFFAEDVISYYPNPVKEELYLKWELTNDTAISSIQLNNMSGQVLKTLPNLQQLNTLTLAFGAYPSGLYLIVLNYSNGQQKTIKIIRQ